MKHATRWVVTVVATLALMATATSVADANGDHHHDGGLQVLADGLDNPRGVSVDHRGHVWVAEAGRGGPTLVDTPLGDSPGPVCVGETGSITRIRPNGRVDRMVSLPSVAEAVGGACGGPGFGAAATGPHGVDTRGRQVSYSTGLGGVGPIRDLLAAGDPVAAGLGMVDHHRRNNAAAADLVAFEDANDPDGLGPDSNPYGLIRSGGATLATDAGGNSLLKVRRNATISTVAVFAPRCVDWTLPFPHGIPPQVNPCGGANRFPADAVPTDVTRARNGDYLVSTLGGFPFGVGDSLVYRIEHHHRGVAVCSTGDIVPADGCAVFADGLTALVGIDVDHRGKVYVVQLADNGILSIDPTGSNPGSVVVLHRRTGERIGAMSGLQLPGGVALDGGHIYVTNNSVAPGAGEVLVASKHCNNPRRCAAFHGVT